MSPFLKHPYYSYEIEDLIRLVKKYQAEIICLKSQNFQLRHIIDNLPATIYWKNKQGAYLGFNKAGAESLRKFNLPYEEKNVLGKTDYEVFPTEMANIFRKNDLEIMQKNSEITREEAALLPSGEKVTQLSTKKPLYNEKGEIIGVIGSTIDISQLKKIEFELRKSKEELEEANRLKMDFIHNMEHDIRTPFNGIFGLASILWRREEDQEKKAQLAHIVTSSQELLGYCNTILDFSKIELGRFPIASKKFNFLKLIEKLINIETAAAIQKEIDLSCDIKNVPKYLIGDEYRIMRILINLLSNAVKFTSEGFVKLSITGHKKTHKKIIIKFIIEDSGIGISEEKQRFVGEKFIRFSNSNKGQYKGLGLGLSAVKQFINDLQAELELESEINKGSKFTCIIPFKLPLLGDA
jgi:PAS domain S-box-containing protein